MGDASLNITGDSARAQKAIDDLQKKYQKLEGQLQGLHTATKRTTQSSSDDFSKLGDTIGAAGAKVAGVAAGVLSLASALGLAKNALADIDALRQKSGEEGRQARIPLANLAQVAGSQAEFMGLQEKAKQFFAGGGAGSIEEAASTIFDIQSSGQMDQLDFLKKARASGFLKDTGEMTKNAIALQTSMGKKETGDLRALVNKAVVASGPSPASTEAILSAAARGGTAAGALGISDEELLAAVSLTSTASGNAERAGTETASLLRSLGELSAPQDKTKTGYDARKDFSEAFKGKNLQQMLGEIQKRNLNPAELQQALGREEAMNAYRVLSANSQQFSGLTADVTKAQRSDIVGQRMTWAEGVPEMQAARQADEAAAREKLTRDRMGYFRNRTDTAITNVEATMRERGAPEGLNWGVKQVSRGVRYTTGDELFNTWATPIHGLPESKRAQVEAAEAAGTAQNPYGAASDPGVKEAVDKNTAALDANTKALEVAAKKSNVSGSGKINVHSE